MAAACSLVSVCSLTSTLATAAAEVNGSSCKVQGLRILSKFVE